MVLSLELQDLQTCRNVFSENIILQSFLDY